MVKLIGRHFEAGFYVYLWANASLLAALVGRPWLGAVGFVTVLPFVVLYVLRARARAG